MKFPKCSLIPVQFNSVDKTRDRKNVILQSLDWTFIRVCQSQDPECNRPGSKPVLICNTDLELPRNSSYYELLLLTHLNI